MKQKVLTIIAQLFRAIMIQNGGNKSNPIQAPNLLDTQNNPTGIVAESSLNQKETEKLMDREEMRNREKALLNVLEDVETEKNKTKLMAKDLQKFQLAVENVSDQIIITNPQGIILYANPGTTNVTGFPQNMIVGKKAGTKELWGGKMTKAYYEDYWKTINVDKKPFVGEITNVNANGIEYSAELKASPILDENGEVIFFVGVERDITQTKEVDKMKTEFISLASHQLRTPLSGMKWFGEMLLNGDAGDLNERQKQFMEKIVSSNERMISLVNALLNVSRIESGRIIIDTEPTSLPELANKILDELQGRISNKKLKIIAKFDNKLKKISIDPKLISEVYSNLLTNAIKYTPEGGEITIMISAEKDDIISQISDTGFGIPKSEQSNIFQKFFRASNIIKVDTDGNGLGMYLIKSIVESSQGKIWFESEENKGSTFWFSLPASGCAPKSGEVTLS